MSAVTMNETRPRVQAPSGSVLPGVIKSEWTKMRSIRSTYWTMAIMVIIMIGLSALVTSQWVAHNHPGNPGNPGGPDMGPAAFSLVGVVLAQLAVAVLGVLTITSEYSSGMIRSTLSAVPQRVHVLIAKGIVFSVLIFLVSVVLSFIAFFIGQSILSGTTFHTTIGAPGSLRIVFGVALYLTVIGLLAMGLGSIMRHSAAAIATLFGLILVLPGIVAALPNSWQNAVDRYLPSNAGMAIFRATARGGVPNFSPWVGFGVFCVYAAVALIVGGLLLRKRDA